MVAGWSYASGWSGPFAVAEFPKQPPAVVCQAVRGFPSSGVYLSSRCECVCHFLGCPHRSSLGAAYGRMCVRCRAYARDVALTFSRAWPCCGRLGEPTIGVAAA